MGGGGEEVRGCRVSGVSLRTCKVAVPNLTYILRINLDRVYGGLDVIIIYPSKNEQSKSRINSVACVNMAYIFIASLLLDQLFDVLRLGFLESISL